MSDRRNVRIDALAMALTLAALFSSASLWGHDPADAPSGDVYPSHAVIANRCGPVGAHLSAILVRWLGVSSLVIAGGMFTVALALFRRQSASEIGWRIVGGALITLALSALAASTPIRTRFDTVFGAGGMIGVELWTLLDRYVSNVGGMLVLLPCLAAGVFLAMDRWLIALSQWSGRRFSGAARGLIALATQPAPSMLAHNGDDGVDDSLSPDAARLTAPREHPEQELRIVKTGFDEPPLLDEDEIEDEETEDADVVRSNVPHVQNVQGANRLANFTLPDSAILDEIETFEYAEHEQEVLDRAKILERTLAEFQMKVKVVQIDTGPVVTQYEIELEPGLRARKVMAMADDLAIALKAPSVRIVAPIPGKNTVGIEVPNERRAKVCLKEVMSRSAANAAKMRLPLYLGKDVKGLPLVCDLATMPHLLIAGRTGTGKSVCLNALILSIVMTRRPDQVKMLMIDPKMVELSLYKDIPHLLHPVVTDMKKAEALLAWAVDKMEERYDLLARVGVRHIDAFNKLGRDEILARLGPMTKDEADLVPDQLPYILVFADEMADLMMTAAKEVESHIIRLAQKSRAVGIHLILATQKPTVDVVTGLIKSNLPARIAFQVASRTDSRVVLDEMGADKLLGNGDMLFLYPGTSKIVRAQGTFVSDEEVVRVTAYLAAQGRPEFSEELKRLSSHSGAKDKEGEADFSERDDLYFQAVDVIVQEGRGSVSLLQRALGVGYGRGARLIDFMAEDGIVGEYNGSQAREVLLTPEEWNDRKRSRLCAT